MTLAEAKHNNLIIFNNWRAYGQPEACDALNNSNRELIKAYTEDFPEAMAFKFNIYTEEEKLTGGVFKIMETENLYNFFCDYIFNGIAENFAAVKEAAEKWRDNKKNDALHKLEATLEAANGNNQTGKL